MLVWRRYLLRWGKESATESFRDTKRFLPTTCSLDGQLNRVLLHAQAKSRTKLLEGVSDFYRSRKHERHVEESNKALQVPYKELEQQLWHESVLNGDETGLRKPGTKISLWVTHAFAFFVVLESRGSKVLEQSAVVRTIFRSELSVPPFNGATFVSEI